MTDINKINEEELNEVNGGNATGNIYRRKVAHIQSGYLALRSQPNYDYANEKRGNELYNGDYVFIEGSRTIGRDGNPYVWVYSPKTNESGYVNANYLVAE